jgi:hypothetical protein
MESPLIGGLVEKQHEIKSPAWSGKMADGLASPFRGISSQILYKSRSSSSTSMFLTSFIRQLEVKVKVEGRSLAKF